MKNIPTFTLKFYKFLVALMFPGEVFGNHWSRVTLIYSIVLGVISYGEKQRDMLMMGLILLYLLDGKNVFGKNDNFFNSSVTCFAHTKSDVAHVLLLFLHFLIRRLMHYKSADDICNLTEENLIFKIIIESYIASDL